MVFEDELANYINSKQVKISQSLGKPQKFKYKQEYYKVKKYLDDFLDGKEGHRVIVMPGLRGVGKTTILNQLCNYLLTEKNINYKDVLYIQMDQIMGYFNTNTLKFIDVFLETIHNTTQVYLDKKLFIFVDECHFDKMWGLAG
ncbi:MAG: AAA family ATPase, partial [Methanobrevibacter sp.]|nr:AAA family ATPase [Methanobrevibacter sp.]